MLCCVLLCAGVVFVAFGVCCVLVATNCLFCVVDCCYVVCVLFDVCSLCVVW